MNDVVLGSVALGALAPAAFTHAVGTRRLADAISAQRALPRIDRGGRGLHYARAVAVAEVAVSALVVLSMWRDDLRLAGLALAVLGALFVLYVSVLRRRRYAGDCGCSAVEAAPSGWSVLPGGVLSIIGLLLATDLTPTASAFASPAGAMESSAAIVLGLTLGFLIWMFPSGVYRHDTVTVRG